MVGKSGLVIFMLAVSLAGCGKPAAEKQAGNDSAQPVVETVAFERTPSPPGARVFFITPDDGESVSNPFRIEFGIKGMTVVKAGSNQPQSGHHHLLIDTGLPDPALPIPADANHKHFGDGSTSTEISLQPGQHSLQLLLADHLHIPHDPPVASDVITVTVE
ncbi:MAG: DUF4399 domain-containing protein [Woeseiaceae bacterium]|nr:DUF4399 domain-containing protein [Woeseiaceae bacterium]